VICTRANNACDAGSRQPVVVEKTLRHEGRDGPDVLRIDSAAGRRGDRGHRLDGLVSAVDGGADHCSAAWVIPRRFGRRRHAGRSTMRRDAALLRQLLAENRFPTIWMPSTEYRDLRSLLLHRHQWVACDARAERAARDCDRARRAARPHAVESRGPGPPRVVACCRRTPRIAAARSRRCIST